jgi:GT2 family glycosyltransferase
MSTSVVVVTHKPDRYLDRCLSSVAGQADELVVVDNASEGDTAGRVAEQYGARYLRMSSNVGFPRGVNAGVEASTSDHVALLNDDAFADPGWLEGSVGVLRDPSIAAVAPKLLFAWQRGVVRVDDPVRFKGSDPAPRGRHVTSVEVGGVDVTRKVTVRGGSTDEGDGFWTTGASLLEFPLVQGSRDVAVNGEEVQLEATIDLINNAGCFLHPGGFCGDIGFGERDNGKLDAAADRFAACGAAMVIRRDTWERVGPFADDFFAYYEDIDWSWRAQLSGLRVRYDPSLVVRHVHGQTAGPGSSMFGFYVSRNRLLCVARNAPSRVAARVLTNLPPLPPWSRRSLAKRLPGAFAHRRRLVRAAVRSPEQVWSDWAGVNVPQ